MKLRGREPRVLRGTRKGQKGSGKEAAVALVRFLPQVAAQSAPQLHKLQCSRGQIRLSGRRALTQRELCGSTLPEGGQAMVMRINVDVPSVGLVATQHFRDPGTLVGCHGFGWPINLAPAGRRRSNGRPSHEGGLEVDGPMVVTLLQRFCVKENLRVQPETRPSYRGTTT